MRVLLIKTSSLGDVIHTLPALTDAARAIPGIQFDWVVEEGFAEIPAWHPAVAQVIPVAIRRWRQHPLQTLRNGEWRRFKARLRETRYDLVLDAQGLLKSAWLTRYVPAPVAGLDRASAREPLASRFYDRGYAVPCEQHAVQRLRQLFAQALDYPLPATVGDYGLDRASMADAGGQPYLLFLHGTTWVSKHWPEADWRALAERMNAQGWAIRLPWGNAVEKARAERIAAGLEHAAVLPKLNLAGVAKVIAGARACVAVDTGLGHLAAALDVPTISLYGPTLPGKVGAYGRGQVHLCASGPGAGSGDRQQPCFAGLDAQRVGTELEALLLAGEDA
ncbi:lipopolysaccharide heptosyltransferase I [Pseudomonas sp. N040]|uniref:lipopolysaccharide heptosyltransferase I n=1 Tax=Pseudomonas sp. N040 TaxID=2785325 RepID=UPI0018A2A7B2|nr:lipopolysaccharide heptosyltransferase I [Pseudomonas sp. N040]MBF7729858.1 lipopolysaccharide heptosyltransferase I [Pseudomonas sp. N040]MBW7013500.1 lipopolysaccharide heptosyltransferase I [Pseudomonas sp. N040]